MPRYIAFLRAINITGRFVKMDDLRREFEAMGFANVQTYIQSGNVLFDSIESNSSALEAMIEQHLQQSLGYPVATFLRSPTELLELTQHVPFPNADRNDDSVLYIVFLREEPSTELQHTLLSYATAIDTLHIFKRHVFWLWRKHLGATTFSNTRIEKILRMQATLRNATTVQKIAAKYLQAS